MQNMMRTASEMRSHAEALLKEAAALDGLAPYFAVCDNDSGNDPTVTLLWSKKDPSFSAAAAQMGFDVDDVKVVRNSSLTEMFVNVVNPDLTQLSDEMARTVAGRAYALAEDDWNERIAEGLSSECVIQSSHIFAAITEHNHSPTDELEQCIESALMEGGFYAKAAEAFKNQPSCG